ncbi:MAG TPA: SDR family NAD(P)-dependent oxidoreductase [Pseudonocardia sp.]|nr:SDR family NAD(P)-dependent oxidoreductase [Pseudonocardia sp.]
MGSLDGLVAVVTGAGRGIGREHALFMASEGASIVVNDLGGSGDGTGEAATPAQEVVAEIEAAGGKAVASTHNVADAEGADGIIAAGVDAFGKVDIVVNNAGVLRDNVLINMGPEDWDVVVTVNLRGTYLVTRAAAVHWRERSKAGEQLTASVVNTASESGLFSNPGQANYAAAKSGVATFTQVAAKELKRYGVRANAILPRARTRLTEVIGGKVMDALQPKEGRFDKWHPANVSPFVAYLAGPGCEISGEVFLVGGALVQRVKPWELDEGWKIKGDERLTVDAIAKEVAGLGLPNGGKMSGMGVR